jgi:hypothetical protein
VLTGEGEVWDFASTVVRVERERPVTLRIRFSRFGNRMQIESVAG